MKIVTLAEFEAATDVKPETRALARAVLKRHGGKFVMYEPHGDELLIEDDRDVLVAHMPEQNSLF